MAARRALTAEGIATMNWFWNEQVKIFHEPIEFNSISKYRRVKDSNLKLLGGGVVGGGLVGIAEWKIKFDKLI